MNQQPYRSTNSSRDRIPTAGQMDGSVDTSGVTSDSYSVHYRSPASSTSPQSSRSHDNNAYDNRAFSDSSSAGYNRFQPPHTSHNAAQQPRSGYSNNQPPHSGLVYAQPMTSSRPPTNGNVAVGNHPAPGGTRAQPSGVGDGYDNRAFTGYGGGTTTPSFTDIGVASGTPRIVSPASLPDGKPVSSVYTVPLPRTTGGTPNSIKIDEKNRVCGGRCSRTTCIVIVVIILVVLIAAGIGIGVGVALSADTLNGTACSSNEFQCEAGVCITYWRQCDKVVDCANKLDEQNCGNCSTSEEYQCQDYGCVSSATRCNGRPDCADQSDEFGCLTRNTESSNVIYGLTADSGWLPVCSQGVSDQLAEQICISLGLSGPATRSTAVINSSRYLRAGGQVSDSTQTIMSSFTQQNQCNGNLGLLLSCQSKACGHSAGETVVSPLIANGEAAEAGRWPWQVGIYIDGLFLCGASLVDEYHVITAGHCMTSTRESAYTLRLGSIHRSQSDPNEQFAYIQRIDNHPKFDPDNYELGYDISVLTLREKVRFGSYVQPVCLVYPQDSLPLSSICYSSGWGVTDYNRSEVLPEVLQQAKMRLWSLEQCQKPYPYATSLLQCAGYESGYIANCPGDSGGPLVCRDPRGYWKLVGVFSFLTVGCNVPEKPSVFSSVQSLLGWIENTTACHFTCDNGKCIWDSRQVCDGVDDCGDRSDESRTCSPSISCEFETRYICGYSRDVSQPSSWIQKSGPAGVNQGPIVDFTLGSNSGSYMYSGTGTTTLLAPIYNRTASHCLQFRYHMRSNTAGRLIVTIVPLSGSGVAIPPYEDQGSLGDIWMSKKMDIGAGVYQLSFSAYATSSNQVAYVALDNVQLLQGNCVQQRCTAAEFECAGEQTCIASGQRCNFYSNCFDESDETGCQAKVPYTCDFSVYGRCGLEQPIEDSGDWSIQTASEANRIASSPSRDATSNSVIGSYAYISTGQASNPGTVSRLFLPIKTSDSQGACFMMRYSIVSTGRLMISYQSSSGSPQTAWSVANVNVSSWQAVRHEVPAGTIAVMVDGTVGAYNPSALISYIAVDDFSITSGTCPAIVCQIDETLCPDMRCITQNLVCDGRNDCQDGSDEKTCPCRVESFRCGNGACLNGHVRCDGVRNCQDGSDEAQCNSCNSSSEYACTSDGRCKLRSTWCDGFSDCVDGSDEANGCRTLSAPGSVTSTPVVCDPHTSWTCSSGDQCVTNSSRCDMKEDCRDGSDEQNCLQLRCSTGLMIRSVQRCDAIPNCPDASDEFNCSCNSTASFQCTAGKCIPIGQRCDGAYNCPDLSDELGCECSSTQFRCDSGLCIASYQRCNNVNNCGDFSDETNCTCQAGQFKCNNGICIYEGFRCDYADDCGDDSDEANCSCKATETRCTSGKCLQREWLCDGYNDCSDGSDEASCNECNATTQYECTNHECVDLSLRCNGVADCRDGADEFNCVTITPFNTAADIVHGYDPTSKGYLPICATNWTNDLSIAVCQLAGLGPFQARSFITLPSSSQQPTLLLPSDSLLNISQAGVVSDCLRLVRVACADASCGKARLNTISPFVIRGEIATEGQWPWAVALFYNNVYQCSAALIDTRWVVTAAHCLYHATTGYSLAPLSRYFTVRMGTTKRIGQTDHLVTVGVDKVYPHPTYHVQNNMLYDDIALIHLSDDVIYNDYVTPVCTPGEDGEEMQRGSLCYALGWGNTIASYGDPALDLRYAKMALWSTAVCGTPLYWGSALRTDGSQICAGYATGDVTMCNGDSGGPLMCRDLNNRWIVRAVVSAGMSGAQGCQGGSQSKPTIFTNVTTYEPWLRSVMSQPSS